MNIKNLLQRQSSKATPHSLESGGRPCFTQKSPLQRVGIPHEQSISFAYPNTALIPCEYDLQTGSSEEAGERSANTAASKRLRAGKKKL